MCKMTTVFYLSPKWKNLVFLTFFLSFEIERDPNQIKRKTKIRKEMSCSHKLYFLIVIFLQADVVNLDIEIYEFCLIK